MKYLLFAGLLALSGCQEEEIQRYKVPKEKPEILRLLGVIMPQPDRIWFFKLSGQAELIAPHEKDFESFMHSVRFTGQMDKPVEWQAPAGWQEEGASSFRFASFRLGTGPQALELTVTPLGKEAASVIDNVNRWRGQMGLRPIEEKDLGLVTKELTINGVSATWVDMTNTIK